MTVQFYSDIQADIQEKTEPCMCAQMAQHWIDFYEGRDTPAIRDNLKQEANPSCPLCKGTGIENVAHEANAPTLELSNTNAAVLFDILGLPFSGNGEMSIPEARRAVIKAQSRASLDKYTRPERKEYGKPREVSPGVVDMKPLKLFERGLSKEDVENYIVRFAHFVSEVIKQGGTKIIWS